MCRSCTWGLPLLRLFPLSNCRLPALSLPNGSTVDYWLSAGGSALPLLFRGSELQFTLTKEGLRHFRLPPLCHPERSSPTFSFAPICGVSGCAERDRGNTYSPTQADGNNHACLKQGEEIYCYAESLQGNFSMELNEVLQDIADAIVRIDKSG